MHVIYERFLRMINIYSFKYMVLPSVSLKSIILVAFTILFCYWKNVSAFIITMETVVTPVGSYLLGYNAV
jgi:hypothetical protein